MEMDVIFLLEGSPFLSLPDRPSERQITCVSGLVVAQHLSQLLLHAFYCWPQVFQGSSSVAAGSLPGCKYLLSSAYSPIFGSSSTLSMHPKGPPWIPLCHPVHIALHSTVLGGPLSWVIWVLVLSCRQKCFVCFVQKERDAACVWLSTSWEVIVPEEWNF